MLLGVSYLNDVGDTRYTPVHGFYQQLEAEGCKITLHDPHVAYWEEKNLEINKDLSALMQDSYDVIVITTGHKDYRNNPAFIKDLLEQKPCFIYDTIGVFTNTDIQTLSAKHTVRVIGRGDLNGITE